MSLIAARRRRGMDFWPGFVDALSALLMVLVFLLLVFSIGQFVLSDALSGRDKTIDQLNAELSQLAKTLSMEQTDKAAALNRIRELAATLSSTSESRNAFAAQLKTTQGELDTAHGTLEQNEEEMNRLGADLASLQALKVQLESEIAARLAELEENKDKLAVQTELSAKSAAQVELLNRQLAAVRQQLADISEALEIAKSENVSKDVQIENLGKELNLALANRVNQLAKYRSEFFGRLREVLGNREDIQIVGDRFVVPSGLLFPSASDELSTTGEAQLSRLASTLAELSSEIPSDIDWVLRIDGHTDKRPISTARFPSNWELSTARAIAIVKYLVTHGIPADHLSANGFGEFQPLDPNENEVAYARNRRIEIQLTNR